MEGFFVVIGFLKKLWNDSLSIFGFAANDVDPLTFSEAVIKEETPVDGNYYRREGFCNGCGQCCQNIALIHDGQVISRLSEFDILKEKFPEYAAFRIARADNEGLLFRCSNLKEDNSCAIYENRPDFCRNYPDETGLIWGGRLPSECSYLFKIKETFDHVLEKHGASR